MGRPAIHHWHFTVTASSIDVLGHVNNREYLRWTETAATAHAESLGWPLDAMKRAGGVWVAHRHWIEYLQPAHQGDEIDLYTWVETMGSAASLRRFAVKSGERLLAVAATEWVYVDVERMRPCLIPETVASSFPLVPADDERLAALGIARAPRWNPTGRNAGGR